MICECRTTVCPTTGIGLLEKILTRPKGRDYADMVEPSALAVACHTLSGAGSRRAVNNSVDDDVARVSSTTRGSSKKAIHESYVEPLREGIIVDGGSNGTESRPGPSIA